MSTILDRVESLDRRIKSGEQISEAELRRMHKAITESDDYLFGTNSDSEALLEAAVNLAQYIGTRNELNAIEATKQNVKLEPEHSIKLEASRKTLVDLSHIDRAFMNDKDVATYDAVHKVFTEEMSTELAETSDNTTLIG